MLQDLACHHAMTLAFAGQSADFGALPKPLKVGPRSLTLVWELCLNHIAYSHSFLSIIYATDAWCEDGREEFAVMRHIWKVKATMLRVEAYEHSSSTVDTFSQHTGFSSVWIVSYAVSRTL